MRILRQLGREDWVEAGLRALAIGGAAALRIDPTARRLGVSKGSFYWHFRDRAAWRDAILAYWEHVVFAKLVAGHRGKAPRPAVRPMPAKAGAAGLALNGASPRPIDPGAVEAALRAWARDDAWVARCLARIAAERARNKAAPPGPSARAA